jgi:isopenicillin-N epimerase
MTDVESPGAKNPRRDSWAIRPGVTYLNHGSFGPSPRSVIAARQKWIERLESEPMDFFVRQMEGHLEAARRRMADVVGTSGDNLVFVDNATFAMNIVAASLPLGPGDQVLANNHEYGAVLRTWRERCKQTGAKFVVQHLPEEFREPGEVADALWQGVTDRTRLIVLSHITSPTALIFPVAEICRRAKERGIQVCIDGPHALAAVPVDLDRLGCDYYCVSCHKWLSAPFGSGFLYVHPRRQQALRPVVVSWGNSLSGRPHSWQDEFVWSGTRDPSPFLAIPAAIDFLAGLGANAIVPPLPLGEGRRPAAQSAGAGEGCWNPEPAGNRKGIEVFRRASRDLVHAARDKISAVTGLEPIGTPDWYGTMITLPLPDWVGETPHNHMHPLQAALWERFQIEAPIVNWNGRRHIRISCHLYNDLADVDLVAAALAELLRSPSP